MSAREGLCVVVLCGSVSSRLTRMSLCQELHTSAIHDERSSTAVHYRLTTTTGHRPPALICKEVPQMSNLNTTIAKRLRYMYYGYESVYKNDMMIICVSNVKITSYNPFNKPVKYAPCGSDIGISIFHSPAVT